MLCSRLDDQLYKNIKTSPLLLPLIRQLASARNGSSSRPSSPTGGPSGSDGASEGEGENGADEIASLSLRILDLTEDEEVNGEEGEGALGLHGTEQ